MTPPYRSQHLNVIYSDDGHIVATCIDRILAERIANALNALYESDRQAIADVRMGTDDMLPLTGHREI